jgi:predicted DNA-binding transcriptional regulator YafY
VGRPGILGAVGGENGRPTIPEQQLVSRGIAVDESVARPTGKSEMSQARLSRCLRLLNMLQPGIAFHTGRLATDLKVSRRTIFRDLQSLRDAGIPLSYHSPQGGYVVGPSMKITAVPLCDEELLALLLAAHVSVLSCHPEVDGLVHRAIKKLLGRASAVFQEEAMNLLNSVVRQPSCLPWPEEKGEIGRAITMALCHRLPLRIVYQATNNGRRPIRTKVTGACLVVSEAHWYLVGRSSWHRKTCKFDVRLIRNAETIVESPILNQARTMDPRTNPQQSKASATSVRKPHQDQPVLS